MPKTDTAFFTDAYYATAAEMAGSQIGSKFREMTYEAFDGDYASTCKERSDCDFYSPEKQSDPGQLGQR